MSFVEAGVIERQALPPLVRWFCVADEAALAGLIAKVETLISDRETTTVPQKGDDWPF